MNAVARWLLTLPVRRNSPTTAPVRHKFRLNVETLEDRTVPSRPLPYPTIYAGAGPNADPVVRSFAIENGFPSGTDILVADPSFAGGVRVASADFTGDGVPDVVAALGSGGEPLVQVFDALTGEPVDGPLGSFLAFESTFTGGVTVACADVDGDGIPDIVCGAGAGGGPRVRVVSGADGSELESFFAFETTFLGGVNVAAADFTGDGKAEIAVGAGTTGGPRVVVFDPTTDAQVSGPLGSFFAFDQKTHDGVAVGAHFKAGDADGDGTMDLVVGTQSGPSSRVKVYSGANGSVLGDYAPFGAGVGTAVSVSLAYIDDDTSADVVVLAQDASGLARVYSGATGTVITGDASEFLPFDPAGSGITIASGNYPSPLPELPVELPEVSVVAVDPTASEAMESTGAFLFTRTGLPDTDLTVTYTVLGTGQDLATPGSDYKALALEAVIPAGEASVAVLVKPIDDAAVESVEWVRVQIAASATGEYTIAEDEDEAEVSIVSDDDPIGPGEGFVMGGLGGGGPGGGGPGGGDWTVLIFPEDPNASEAGESTGAFRVVRMAPLGAQPTTSLTVYYTVGGTATPGDDYAPISTTEEPYTGSVTIPVGKLSAAFLVAPVDDKLPEGPYSVEGAEDVEVSLYEVTGGGYVVGYLESATVTIADNDDKPKIMITYADSTEVSQKTGLKVAHWSDAFIGGTKIVNGQTFPDQRVEIKGPDTAEETLNHDFIDRDPDRFNVWVLDKAAAKRGAKHIEALIDDSYPSHLATVTFPTSTAPL